MAAENEVMTSGDDAEVEEKEGRDEDAQTLCGGQGTNLPREAVSSRPVVGGKPALVMPHDFGFAGKKVDCQLCGLGGQPAPPKNRELRQRHRRAALAAIPGYNRGPVQ